MTGKKVKALVNKGGEIVSKIGRFMGLKLVDSQCLAQIQGPGTEGGRNMDRQTVTDIAGLDSIDQSSKI